MRTATGSGNTVHGVHMTLDSTSNWAVTAQSTLTRLTLDPGASITGVNGASVTMTVDGMVAPIAAGVYTGNIVLPIG